MKFITNNKEKTAKAIFTVLNEKGLHTRPSTELVKCANLFNCTIHFYYKNYMVNGKSILGVLMLAAEKGAKITIEAKGRDAKKAINAILKLAIKKFLIKY